MTQTAFVADFIVQVSTDYTTGPESVKAFLPYTSVLRPVFYAYRSTKMRLAVGNFVNSVMLSRRVSRNLHQPAPSHVLMLRHVCLHPIRCWALAWRSSPCAP